MHEGTSDIELVLARPYRAGQTEDEVLENQDQSLVMRASLVIRRCERKAKGGFGQMERETRWYCWYCYP